MSSAALTASRAAIFKNPLSISFGIHALLLLAALLMMWRSHFSLTQKIDFEVLEYPKLATSTMQIKQPAKEQVKPPAPEPPRAVFGVSRNAITAADSAPDAAQIKQGNTVAKAEDNLKLDKSDADQLPIPTDDFLVTSMPRLKAEVRIPYPEQAKKAGVEGPVVMDLLIDEQGRVRQVSLIKGPGFGLNEAAQAVAERFEFTPGRVADRAVAVKIRYTYRFVLENR